MKQNKMLKNALILSTAMIVTKLIGAALKIPLTNILGGNGMGYFSAAFNLFSPIYAVTAAALPVVIMRMTAQNAALGKYRNIRRIRRAGLLAALGLGTIGTVGIIIIAKPFSEYIAGSPDSFLSMLIIAPSLLICSIAAIYRGYYEGLTNMLPTAISQIIEAIIKSILGIYLSLAVFANGGSIAYAAAAAIGGITVSELFGLVFLFLRTRFLGDGISQIELQNSPEPQRKRVIIKSIVTESLPITLAALSMNLNPFIDLLTIPSVINAAVAQNKKFFLQNFLYEAHGSEQLSGLSDIGNFFYGSYTGIAVSIFAIATSVAAMIGKSALPEITSAWQITAPANNRSNALHTKENRTHLIRSLRILFKGTFTIGFPLCFGLAALAKPILSLLYFSKPAEVLVSTPPLIALGIGGITLILSGTLFGIFIAINRADLQVKLMLSGAAIKFAANLILIRIPHINVTGAAISSVICYTFISVSGFIILKRLLNKQIGKGSLKLIPNIAKPLISAMLCAATAYICHNILWQLPKFINYPNALKLAMSTAAGGLVYLILIVIFDRKLVISFLPRRSRRRLHRQKHFRKTD